MRTFSNVIFFSVEKAFMTLGNVSMNFMDQSNLRWKNRKTAMLRRREWMILPEHNSHMQGVQ